MLGTFAKRWLGCAAPLPLFFVIAVLLQYLAGAYHAELSGYVDESAHFVTGKMVADYLSTFPHPPPMLQFAKDFYIQRPKVAIGHWPPLFYLIQGVWFLLFAASRQSVLLLMALITSAVATTVYAIVRSRSGAWTGLAAGVLFLLLPEVQEQTQRVMIDMLVCLFGLWATLAFADFIGTDSRKDAFRFAVFALLAIFSKGNGLYLALLPPLALLFSKRVRLLRSPRLWFSAAFIGLPASAWFAFTARFMAGTWVDAPGLSFVGRALAANTRYLETIFGAAFILLILAGVLFQLRVVVTSAAPDPYWSALLAAALSVFLFQSIVPASLEPRFLLSAIPALIPFMFVSKEWVASWMAFRRWPAKIPYAAVLAAAALLFAVQTFAIPRKPYLGFTEAANLLLSLPEARQAAILVSSQSDGESLLISEITMGEHSRSGFLLRASKVLSRADWLSRDYHPRFSSTDELQAYLDRVPVDFVVVDGLGPDPLRHHRLLTDLVSHQPGHWRLLGAFPRHPDDDHGSPIQVFHRIGAPGRPDERVRLEMGEILKIKLR